jgi:hypothetical protein
LKGVAYETIDRIVESNLQDIAFYKELIETHLPPYRADAAFEYSQFGNGTGLASL